MKLDCYAVLGLSPTAEDAVIRAAYLALMRSYHPDRNPSPEAAARVRAISEAYKTIGDPARRAAYDAQRRAHLDEFLGYEEALEPRRPRAWPSMPAFKWLEAPVMGRMAAAAAVLLAVAALPLLQSGQADTTRLTTAGLPPGKAPGTDDSAANVAPAAEQRPAPAAPTPRLADAVPAPAPADKLAEKAVATHLEPSVAKDRPASAKTDAPPVARRTAAAIAATPSARQTAARKPAPVDEKARIAALEGMSTSFYNQSVTHADEARRLQLEQTRALFLNARNACQSDKCVGDAHASYIRDIGRIMQKPKLTNE